MDNDNNFLTITLISENVRTNINIINNLKEHLKTLLSDNIILSNKYNDYIDQIVFHINIFPKQSPDISFYPSGENYKLVTAHP